MTKLIPGKLYKTKAIISADYTKDDIQMDEIVMFLYLIKGITSKVNRYFFMHNSKIIDSYEFEYYMEKILDRLI